VLSLTGKLIAETTVGSTTSAGTSVVTALVGLGYQDKNARSAVESLTKEDGHLTESELLKQALALLSAGRK
jgi:Holliday junction resolvasome RuvABC DNA-binding subunit